MKKQRESFAVNNNEASVDEKKIKSDDIISLSTTEETLLNKSLQFTRFNVENIRFIPEAIEFTDALEGKQLAEKITIQNVGRNPIYIKIGEPNSFIFHLKKPIRRAKLLGSGCSVTRVVSYNYNNDDLVQSSQIPVQINGQLLYYPLFVKKNRPKIEVRPRQLDFGVINLGVSPAAITLTISNKGDKRTKFEIDVKKNFLDLTATPMRGTVASKGSVNVTVDMASLKEGEFYQELWIKTTELPIRVPVLVEIIRPRIEFAHPKGADNLGLISFRPTFVGTQRVESIVLRNHSVEDTLYIIVAEVNGEVQLLKNARSSTCSFRMFTLSSEEGQLKPFENRILNVVFCPTAEVKKKGWHHKEFQKKNETTCKCIVFFRIIRVHCLGQEELSKIEMIAHSYITKNSSRGQHSSFKTSFLKNFESSIINSQPPEDILRFCLLGEAVEPDILIQPLNFEFGDLNLGQTENKVLRVTNNSAIAVKCTFCKICNVKITPKEVWLKNGKAQEFLVSLTPTCAGRFKTKMKVRILAESDVVSANKTLETIVVSAVILNYNANDVLSIPFPKIGLGITPLITDEVGLQKELITYRNASKFPYSAMLGLKQGFKPAWMRKEEDQLKNVDNAMVALPNDRPRLFYSWPKDEICRTIFKGFFRYSPPEDLTYTLSPEGKIERKERRAVWADYISVLRELRLTKHSDSKELEFYLKYDLCSKKHNNMEDYKPNLNSGPKTPPSKKFKMFLEEGECFPLNELVPLSPFFLSNVIVEPKLINFNTVISETVAQETITVNNINPFPIGVQFISEKSTVSVREKDVIIVQPSETKSVHVLLQPNNSGLHVGIINYIINGNHKFQINTYAIVNPKILILEDNKELSQDPCHAGSDLTLSRNLESMKLFSSERSFGVYFINSRIDLCDISLNFPVRVKPIIRNANYCDVCFEVICKMPGATVEPQEGVIKARGFLPLDVKLCFPVIMKFCFDIIAVINSDEHILVEITGNVVLPSIKISPSEVIMKKICAHSVEAFVICVENAGATPAEMTIDFKNWSQFRVANGQSKFYLPPKESSNIAMNFEPMDAGRYAFYLPIIINNILGPPMIQDRETEFVDFYTSDFEGAYKYYGEIFNTKNSKLKIPSVFINASVTQSLIKLSLRNIRFQLNPNSESEFHPQYMKISNDFTDEVTFCIRNDDLGESNGSPFNLIPVPPDSVEYRLKSMKAQLKRGEKLNLKATFNPKKLGSYSISVPIFVRGYGEGLVYNYIYMSGESKPRIHCDKSQIHFPPLPLGIECEAVLTIRAENYDASDFINCFICDSEVGNNDCEQKYLTATWLDEPHVTQRGVTYLFQLKIQFRSSVPIAIRKYILVFDSMGEYVAVLVTAIADNSSLTNHAFLIMKASKFRLIRDEPFQLRWKTDEVFLEYPINKDDLKRKSQLTKTSKKRGNKATDSVSSKPNSSTIIVNDVNNTCPPVIYEGSRLIMQTIRLTSKPTHVEREAAKKVMGCQEQSNGSSKIPALNSPIIHNETNNVTSDTLDASSHPNFPALNNSSREYFEATLNYVEKWIFEVVMKGDQYLAIPRSFQCLREQAAPKPPGNKEAAVEVETEKDFLDLLGKIIGKNQNLPERPILNKGDSPFNRAKALVSFYTKVLKLLESEGCLLPHVRPEHLMDYENYITYSQTCQNVEYFSGKYKETEKSSSLRNGDDQTNFANKSERKLANTSSELSDEPWGKGYCEDLFRTSDDEAEKPEGGSLEGVEHRKQPVAFLPAFLNGKLFKFKREKLDKAAFDSASTQAWLDTIIQVFRVFVLTKIVPKSTIPEVLAVEKTDKIMLDAVNLAAVYNYGKGSKSLPCVDSYSSNIYSVQSPSNPFWVEENPTFRAFSTSVSTLSQPGFLCFTLCILSNSIAGLPITSKGALLWKVEPKERILLGWLNHHLRAQKEILWKSEKGSFLREKSVNNFEHDLSDSIALIAVTASHCPYIVTDYFKNVSLQPEAPDQLQQNAEMLIEAWEVLSVGLTPSISDLLKPNPVFMVMLVAHLYEFLPALHPHSLICFSAPLNSEFTRSLVLKNESQKRILYRAKFFGEYEELFQLKDESFIELQQSKVINVRVKFTVRKIKRVFATLVLSAVSPTLAKHLSYYLEGEPSELPEHERFAFNAPLYKVICARVPVTPPYSDPAVYEVWYTTKRPQYSHKAHVNSIFSPWSKIWKNKVSRRLFLNKCEIKINEKKMSDVLDVTIACFTKQKRSFWLLFRSSTSDFIVLIEIKPKLLDTFTASYCIKAPLPSAECICGPKNKLTPSSCPFFMNLMIPKRNDALWGALQTMFFKTLQPKEKAFWAENFECNSGISLILWLLSPEEEEEVVDEFVQVLSTKVTYLLSLESNDESVLIPSEIEISDVRERSDVAVPIHLPQNTPLPLNLKITMTSKNEKEIRMLNVHLEPSAVDECRESVVENSKITGSVCHPACAEDFPKPWQPQKKRRNSKLMSSALHKRRNLKNE